MIRTFLLTMLCLLLTATTVAHAQTKKILYVPIDSRPCNLYQVEQVAEKLGYEILTPPAEFLGTRINRGEPEGCTKMHRTRATLSCRPIR